MKPLIDVNTGQLVSSGLIPGTPVNQPLIWRNGVNVLFSNHGVEKLLGVTTEGTESSNINALVQAFVNGEKRVYVLSQNKIRRWLDGVANDISPVGLSVSYAWSAISWGTWLIATNNVDPPYIWKNTGVSVALAGLTGILTRAKLVKKLRNMVIFLGTASSEQTVTWSNVSAPEEYDPTVAGTFAGQLPIRDADSDIVAAHPLSGDMLIYTSDSMIRMSYIGYPNVWGFDPALPGIGAVSDSAVVPVQRMHYGMGRDGFWQTDGVTYTYIGRPDIQELWEEQIDRTRLAQVVGFHYKLRNMVIWYYPLIGDGFLGVGYDYVAKTWTLLNQQVSAGGDEQGFQWPVVALGTTWGFFDQTDSADLGGSMTANIRTNVLDAGQPERLKRWDMLRAQVTEQVGDLQVRFGFSDVPFDPLFTFTDWTTFASLAYENWIGRESVYLIVEFRTITKSAKWRLGGFTVLGEVTGYKV